MPNVKRFRAAKKAKRELAKRRAELAHPTEKNKRVVKRRSSQRLLGVVSVLMTAYRSHQWLQEAMDSVFKQRLPPRWQLELLVGVDACPSSLGVARSISSPRLRVFEFAKNSGTYRTLNTLLTHASGDLIAILDSDDIALPGRMQIQIEEMCRDPSLQLFGGRYKILEDGKIRDGPSILGNPTDFFRARGKMAYALHSTWCARRELYHKLGGYRPWRKGADSDFYLRVVASGESVKNTAEFLCTRRIHSGQLSEELGKSKPVSEERKRVMDLVLRDHREYARRRRSPQPQKMDGHRVANVHLSPLGTKVGVLVPTIPGRESSARDVVRNLLGQGVDTIFLHLNGHHVVPYWAMDRRITTFLNPQGTGPIVRWCDLPETNIVLSVDDDLIYPENYVHCICAHLRHLGPGCAVSYHCSVWSKPGGKLEDRRIIGFYNEVKSYKAASYMGCGVSGFFRRDLERVERIGTRLYHRLDDVWISAAVARAGLKLFRPPSPRKWIVTPRNKQKGIYEWEQSEGFATRQRAIADALRRGKWTLCPSHNDRT